MTWYQVDSKDVSGKLFHRALQQVQTNFDLRQEFGISSRITFQPAIYESREKVLSFSSNLAKYHWGPCAHLANQGYSLAIHCRRRGWANYSQPVCFHPAANACLPGKVRNYILCVIIGPLSTVNIRCTNCARELLSIRCYCTRVRASGSR